jgi:uncharacterized protein (TIGR03437 family)
LTALLNRRAILIFVNPILSHRVKNMMEIPRLARFALLIAAILVPAWAADTVAWDASGNGLLNGTYNFREVMWGKDGDLHRVAIYGSIVFHGDGTYALSSSVIDSAMGAIQPFSTTGAYRISASGMGFMDDPIRVNASRPSSTVWGLVSQGIFIGSSTDDHINSLFIAALASANTTFSGSYRAVAANFPSGDVSQSRDMSFPLNPNGQGSLGTLNLTGLVGLGGTTMTQNVNNATYSIANGAVTINFGGSLGPQTLIAGSTLCYLSADGNFFFGGSAAGWDMIVGVRAFTGSVPANALNGMYYQAGADVTPSQGFSTLATYYGAFTAGSGTIVGHQRLLTGFDPAHDFTPFDYTYSDSFALAADGSHEDFLGFHNMLGAGGAIRIGFGDQSRLGINIALKAPDFSGSGTYLNPAGVANAASSAPFTVGISRGGFIALYGSGLSSTTLQNEKMPVSLGGVQVLINSRPAPVYYVRSDVILAIVPFATTGGTASIQVVNNGVASATTTVLVKNSTPGIYTNPPGGVGYSIAQHVQDGSYSTITPQNPARPGETILLYVNGLGDVNPQGSDGVPAPSNPPSSAVTTPLAVVDGELSAVGFAGLSPTLIGVYAMTVTIPADIGPGDVYVDISLPDSYTTEAQISIGTSNLATQRAREKPAVQIPGTLRRFPNR